MEFAQATGASHNDQAGNTQDLDFLSRQRDIYDQQGAEESHRRTGPYPGAAQIAPRKK